MSDKCLSMVVLSNRSSTLINLSTLIRLRDLGAEKRESKPETDKN